MIATGSRARRLLDTSETVPVKGVQYACFNTQHPDLNSRDIVTEGGKDSAGENAIENLDPAEAIPQVSVLVRTGSAQNVASANLVGKDVENKDSQKRRLLTCPSNLEAMRESAGEEDSEESEGEEEAKENKSVKRGSKPSNKVDGDGGVETSERTISNVHDSGGEEPQIRPNPRRPFSQRDKQLSLPLYLSETVQALGDASAVLPAQIKSSVAVQHGLGSVHYLRDAGDTTKIVRAMTFADDSAANGHLDACGLSNSVLVVGGGFVALEVAAGNDR
jgi:hypothetical protein